MLMKLRSPRREVDRDQVGTSGKERNASRPRLSAIATHGGVGRDQPVAAVASHEFDGLRLTEANYAQIGGMRDSPMPG